ncbi:HlyD family efflux transporter periplasmic adaptor subunit [Bacillus sp. OK048]|uniref:HlyD family efflux transporter periplasmic adaptor subunit n=1 Tax=Bacillus sp. OK048 TaxID=1882761 RepID=UPI00087E96F7|nr:HlyD family efflux transporter periplasmic adaptor subunit [Bacillus sp. OK048]SDM84391.1 type I secretion membrane fusion protein, HlyD family [Bacillus sp. OK048]
MKLYNTNELKDSRIFFDKRPPIFLTLFIGMVVVILVVTFYFSKVFVKPYIVKAQGAAITSDTQLISSQMNGEVISIHTEEGQKVSTGDVLFTISNGQEGLQNAALTEQVANLNEKLGVMTRYEESLNKKVNHMSNSSLEQEYYGKVEYYLLQVKTESFNKKNLDIQLNDKKNKKVELDRELTSLTNELKTLKENRNKVSSVQETSTEEHIVESIVEENKLKETEMEGKIDAKKSEIEGIKEEISQIEQQVNNPSSQIKDTYHQLTSELGVARSDVQSKLVELEGQMAINTGQESSLVVKAKNDGIVHYLLPLQVGMSIQTNQVVAEVSNNSDDDLQVEAYIDAKDISKVVVGQKVRIAIEGINTYKYGTIDGELISVDSGALTQETNEGNQLYFKCLVSVPTNKLDAGDGSTVKLIKSMPVEARIVYEEETYLEWVLGMLNFKNS